MNSIQAERLARRFHAGQTYGEKPYVDAHVAPVVARVIAEGGGEDAIVVAWMHDVLEDCDVDQGPPEENPLLILTRAQAVALNAMTRRPTEDYQVYLQRVVTDPLARLVKYCDLLQNLSCQPPEHLRKRYLSALELVRCHLDEARQLPRRSMMRAAAAAAAEADKQLGKGWSERSAAWRATAVLEWCTSHDWPLSSAMFPRALEVAMQRMPYWAQGPSNYFDMARALSAVNLLEEP